MSKVLWPDGTSGPTPAARVTSEYGMRTHPVTGRPSTFHYGIDLVGWSRIKSPVDGIVSFAGYNGGAGNEVRIRADGPNAFRQGDVFRLLHNRELWVRTGQRVSQGQDVAIMGTTGSSTGVHCHEETRPGGGASINPRDYYAQANAGSSGGGTKPPISEEDDMTDIMLKVNKNIYMLSPGQIKLFENTDEVRAAKADGIVQYDCTGTTAQQNAQFNTRLDRYGIPRDVVAHGEGWVLNPENGKHEKNGFWSWDRVNKGLIDKQNALLAKIAKATKAG